MFPLPKGKPEFPELEDEQFDNWNAQKKELHQSIIPKNLYINPREIWYVKMGMNVGSETNGKTDFRRPVLVLKKFGSMFFVLPLTTHGKTNMFHFDFHDVHFINPDHTPAVCRGQLSQVKMIDKRRFLHMIGHVGHEEFGLVQDTLVGTLLQKITPHHRSDEGDPEGHL